ncbi:MAG: hypothetical protein KDC85_04640 [Saprospiraceae bacterium]|nr:hypothetical protein [Saprospiraceae bacterium]MCB9325115.1 hypothetical protein [Lewinellaceae bacterium]
MQQNFTSELLVKYLYHETTSAERRAINEELIDNYLLREEFSELLYAFQQLPKVKFEPSKTSIQSILNYSKETALEELA